jgi:hypothetical protein
MVKHPIKEQVKSGFRRAGGWLLGIAWLSLVYGGIIEAFGPSQAFSEGHHPFPILGYTLLITAAVIMIVTAEHWKRVFPGIMLAAIFNSLLELSRGHAINSPSVPVAPSAAAVHLLVSTGVAALTLTFKNRTLTVLDRVALLAFVSSFFWGAIDKRFASLKLIVGACCILVAWTVNRLRTGRAGQSSRAPAVGTPSVHPQG